MNRNGSDKKKSEEVTKLHIYIYIIKISCSGIKHGIFQDMKPTKSLKCMRLDEIIQVGPFYYGS